ncbi:MAG: hypothetical protein ACHQAZ_00645 [Gammaproteobacteria bacterium]
MDSAVSKIGAWFRKAYQAIKDIEDAMDYRYQDYAQARMDRLERRMTALEGTAKK